MIPKTAHTYGEWKVVKEATETEEGLKSHSCTVCGAEETASIPKKGATGGTETPEVPTGDSKVHNFTTSGANRSFFVISGNLASNKGTVTYNGLTLTQCLKMESSTSIKFTASSKGTLTLVFGESGKNVKINGKKNASDSNCIVTVDVAAGSVEITKGDTMNLFYIIYTPEKTIPTPDPVEKKNGLSKAEDGNYYYYADDVVDTSFTGFADCDNERMYVKNGKVDTTYTSVEQDGADWVYVENGKIRYDYTGIRQNSNGWWRIEDGKVNFNFTGLADNENGRFYIQNGKVNFEYTNLIQDGADWVYVKNGHVQSNYTGFATNENGRFYLENGKVNFGYTNVIQDGSDWVYVKGGYIRYDYTGIRQNANGWWRIENGKVNFKYNGVASNENGMFYLENGLVKFNYTGTYIQNGIKYNIVNGVVKGKENVLTVMRMPNSVLTNSIKMVI